MVRRTILALGLPLLSPRVFGQATPTQSQTLEALLAEVHQLRQDLHAVATAGRRAQILIYRLYVQEAVVARAAEHLDQATSAFDEFEARKKAPEERGRSACRRKLMSTSYLILATRPAVGNFWNCSLSWPGTTRSAEPANSIIRA